MVPPSIELGKDCFSERCVGESVLREWPESWNMAAAIRVAASGSDISAFPPPGRFLHDAITLESRPGRGRCFVSREALSAGELLLVDRPLATAVDYTDLAQLTLQRAAACPTFRRAVLMLCGGESVDVSMAPEIGPTKQPRTRNAMRPWLRIVELNFHEADPLPQDGCLSGGERCGLWPLASLFNHSLRPNVARVFIGGSVCIRAMRSLAPDDELVDNYLDLLMPHEQRHALLKQTHGICDEGPDEFDAPDTFIGKLDWYRIKAEEELKRGNRKEAFNLLCISCQLCIASGSLDPAFCTVFKLAADCSALMGRRRMQIQCLWAALQHAVAREIGSSLSCVLSAALLAIALNDDQCLEGTDGVQLTLDAIESLARDHVCRVYGPGEAVFAALNPGLAKQLAVRGNEVYRVASRWPSAAKSRCSHDNERSKVDSRLKRGRCRSGEAIVIEISD